MYVTDRKTVDKCQQVVSIFLVITGDYTPNFNGNDYTYFFIHKVEIEAIYQKMTSRRLSLLAGMGLLRWDMIVTCIQFNSREIANISVDTSYLLFVIIYYLLT